MPSDKEYGMQPPQEATHSKGTRGGEQAHRDLPMPFAPIKANPNEHRVMSVVEGKLVDVGTTRTDATGTPGPNVIVHKDPEARLALRERTRGAIFGRYLSLDDPRCPVNPGKWLAGDDDVRRDDGPAGTIARLLGPR